MTDDNEQERWTDEEHNLTPAEKLHAYFKGHIELSPSEGMELVRRLRGGEGERLEKLEEASGALETLWQETRPVEGHGDPDAVEDCFRIVQGFIRSERARRLRGGEGERERLDALERLAMRMEHYLVKEQAVGTTSGDHLNLLKRVRRFTRNRNAAPDTEGREEQGMPDEIRGTPWRWRVCADCHAYWALDYDHRVCNDCGSERVTDYVPDSARPEEAGGEGPFEGLRPEAETMREWSDGDLIEAVEAVAGDLCKRGQNWSEGILLEACDRLRGAPEGAGDGA